MADRTILVDHNFGGVARIVGLLDAVTPQGAVTLAQLNAAIEGLAWKDNARCSTASNISIASPGATLDGVTMVVNDRVLVRGQTSQPENGIYIWNGAAVPMTRAPDASTFDELESAVVSVDEGTSAGSTFRQSTVNGAIGTNNVVWGSLGTSAPAASETVAGIAEIATQAETDAGVDDLRFVTPLKLKTSPLLLKKYTQVIGDGSSVSIAVTHSLNTRQIIAQVFQDSGTYDQVDCEVELTSTTVATFKFNTAPASNALRVNIVA